MDTQECKKRRFKEGQVFVTKKNQGVLAYLQIQGVTPGGEMITSYSFHCPHWYSVNVDKVFMEDVSDDFKRTNLPDLLTALLTGKVLGKKPNGS